MKLRISFILATSVMLLLTVSLVSAHNDGTATNSDQPGGHMTDNQGNHMGNNNYPGMNMGHSGFEGFSDHMVINGNITINDSILLSISVLPSGEIQNMMGNNHRGGGQDHSMDMMDYTNMMSVTLSKLVEFEDLTLDGFTGDDTIISEYRLNKTTLNDVVFNDTSNSYVITSKDGSTFTMIIEINDENSLPYSWKWSLVINYPFTSSNTSLAMLHEINSKNRSFMEMYQEQNNGTMENHIGDWSRYFDNNHMSDNHDNLPMFFSWDSTALVDNKERNITATNVDNSFALSIVQGSQIYYDPQVGIEPSGIINADSIFNDISIVDFIDTVNSPTKLGLLIGFLVLIGIAGVAFIRKNR